MLLSLVLMVRVGGGLTGADRANIYHSQSPDSYIDFKISEFPELLSKDPFNSIDKPQSKVVYEPNASQYIYAISLIPLQKKTPS